MSSTDVVYYNLTIGNNDPIKEGQLTTNDIEANIEAYNNIPKPGKAGTAIIYLSLYILMKKLVAQDIHK